MSSTNNKMVTLKVTGPVEQAKITQAESCKRWFKIANKEVNNKQIGTKYANNYYFNNNKNYSEETKKQKYQQSL